MSFLHPLSQAYPRYKAYVPHSQGTKLRVKPLPLQKQGLFHQDGGRSQAWDLEAVQAELQGQVLCCLPLPQVPLQGDQGLHS